MLTFPPGPPFDQLLLLCKPLQKVLTVTKNTKLMAFNKQYLVSF